MYGQIVIFIYAGNPKGTKKSRLPATLFIYCVARLFDLPLLIRIKEYFTLKYFPHGMQQRICNLMSKIMERSARTYVGKYFQVFPFDIPIPFI